MYLMTMTELTRQDAVRVAHRRTLEDDRVFVARHNGLKFFVVPLYEEGKEGERHDAGYAQLGILIKDSLPLYLQEKHCDR